MENSGKHTQFATARLVEMSVFAGLSYVLMFLSVPIIPIVPYMRLDLADMPILLGTVLFGPVGGMTIAGLKALLYWVTTGADVINFIGVGSSLVSSLVLIWTYYLADRLLSFAKGWKKAALMVLMMATTLTIIMSLTNWLGVIPLYMNLIGMKLGFPLATVILAGVVPFDFIKGIVVGTVFYLIKNSFLPRLKLR
ncbi:ECF transporter S component [Lentilactobacillus parakefiri]|uniref:Riboflavin transporter n=1 Tax=Lentilactobacillus parakefiri TaxID=152332 RepID=A0A269YKL8_9LACO|nr:ECF transporter S component [Lentilactobacillus parakefiri]PAK86088.1 ECF transporter S component [Lentilactobacillus parakefiri]